MLSGRSPSLARLIHVRYQAAINRNRARSRDCVHHADFSFDTKVNTCADEARKNERFFSEMG